MPFGNALGEVVAKMTSVRITDLGGGQRRLEVDSTGEVKGQVPGQGFATMVVEGITGASRDLYEYGHDPGRFRCRGTYVRAWGRHTDRRRSQNALSWRCVLHHRRPQAGCIQRPTWSR